ncbi:hypothetical protein NC653_017178 [Populus alba x Populus x berolinensis]|uniref:Uncharacterized protein n=1 Tax=Populus alba x Populus x berolinensis TaxID=444605 RepID=A0AAD6QPM8_9ROSI|nr:hypothetical protein NC653_017178 [Populus alba x Populus x berolinensis]
MSQMRGERRKNTREGETEERGTKKNPEKGHESGGTKSKPREPEDKKHRRTRMKYINTDTNRQIQRKNKRPKKVKDEKEQKREFLFSQQPHAFIAIVVNLQQPGKFFISLSQL